MNIILDHVLKWLNQTFIMKNPEMIRKCCWHSWTYLGSDCLTKFSLVSYSSAYISDRSHETNKISGVKHKKRNIITQP